MVPRECDKGKSDLELNREIYERVYAKKEEPLYEPFLEIIAKIIRKQGFTRILDYGCGPGKAGAYLKRALADYAYTIDGSDISRNAFDVASKYYDAVIVGNGTDLPDKRYDLVLLNSLIEHISPDKLEALFGKIADITDAVFLVVPNFKSPRRYLLGRSRELEKERRELGHVNILSHSDIRALLKRNGFDAIRFSFCHAFKDIDDTTYQLFRRARFVYRLYSLLSLFPFYFLRDSFWVYAEKRRP